MRALWPMPAGLHTASIRLPVEGQLPAFEGATGWLNSPPLTDRELRGKVVLVNFWTYTCINWLRQLPYVRAWAEKYSGQGLVVIGVHTPEFSFEHDGDNVGWAVQDTRIGYPVAIDSDYAIWRAFDNHYWPALYVADVQGRIRHHHFGEGEYQRSEMIIQQLLVEAGFGTSQGRLGHPEIAGKLHGLRADRKLRICWRRRTGGAWLVHDPGDAEAQPLGSGGQLDDGARGHQAEHGERADRLPLSRP